MSMNVTMVKLEECYPVCCWHCYKQASRGQRALPRESVCVLSIVSTQSWDSFLKCLKENVLDLGQMAGKKSWRKMIRKRRKPKRKTLRFNCSAACSTTLRSCVQDPVTCPLGNHAIRDVNTKQLTVRSPREAGQEQFQTVSSSVFLRWFVLGLVIRDRVSCDRVLGLGV